jgi:hypothetical protein
MGVGVVVGSGFALLAATGAAAQTEGSVLAVIPASTRSIALGGAGVALVGDAAALFANPAGIATVRRVALEASYERYLAGTTLSAAAMAIRFGRFDWGMGAQALDYGTEPEIVPDPATGGRRGMPTGGYFRSADLLAATSLVFRHGLLAVGTSAKYARQTIGAAAADAWAADVGVAIAVFDIMAVGAAVQNLGGDLGPRGAGQEARLPRRGRVGFTLNYTDPQGVFRLLTTVESQWGGGIGTTWIVGLEGGLVAGGLAGVGLVGRLGYAKRPADLSGAPLSAGAGVVLGRLQLDYAYRTFEALGATHRVGLRWTP